MTRSCRGRSLDNSHTTPATPVITYRGTMKNNVRGSGGTRWTNASGTRNSTPAISGARRLAARDSPAQTANASCHPGGTFTCHSVHVWIRFSDSFGQNADQGRARTYWLAKSGCGPEAIRTGAYRTAVNPSAPVPHTVTLRSTAARCRADKIIQPPRSAAGYNMVGMV